MSTGGPGERRPRPWTITARDSDRLQPYVAAARGMVDDVIEPADTRSYIALSLEILKSKREIRPEKKHGLIPL